MGLDVPVSLLVPVVLGHIVQVIASHHDGSLHFCRYVDAPLGPDGDVGGEGAFSIDVNTVDDLLGSLEA